TLYALRRDLHAQELFLGSSELRLNPQVVSTDVQEFEAALAQVELERAVALYHGPFLDGFFLSGAPEFERWTDGERARLAQCLGRGALPAGRRSTRPALHDRAGAGPRRHHHRLPGAGLEAQPRGRPEGAPSRAQLGGRRRAVPAPDSARGAAAPPPHPAAV